MKLIMENWRGYINEGHIREDLLLEVFRQYEKGELEEGMFRNIVVGLGLAVGTMFLTLQAERSGELQQAVAQIQQNQAELDTNQEKHAELEELLMNPAAWQWSDDPWGGLGYPKIEIDNEWHTIMPDSWSIAAKVAADKAAGVVDIPGMAVGELPTDVELYKNLKNPGTKGTANPKTFKAELGGYLTPTTDHGSTLKAMAGQMSPPGPAPDFETYQMSTVAVDADYFEANPDYMTTSGFSAQDLYIQYYFGKYLGADEAVKYGLELANPHGSNK